MVVVHTSEDRILRQTAIIGKLPATRFSYEHRETLPYEATFKLLQALPYEGTSKPPQTSSCGERVSCRASTSFSCDGDLRAELEELITSTNVLLFGRDACAKCEQARLVVRSADPSGNNYLYVDIGCDTNDDGAKLLHILERETHGQELPIVFVRGQLQTLEDLQMMAEGTLLMRKMGLSLGSSPQQQARVRVSTYYGKDDDSEFEDAATDEDPASLALTTSDMPQKRRRYLSWKKLRNLRKKVAKATGKHHFFKDRKVAKTTGKKHRKYREPRVLAGPI